MLKPLFYLLFAATLVGCASLTLPQSNFLFGERLELGKVRFASLNELSGLAASKLNPDILWAHNDSGDVGNLYAIKTHGRRVAVFRVNGCSIIDWEDMAMATAPQSPTSYLYIGDIGDNGGVRESIQVCRVVEPNLQHSEGGERALAGQPITLVYPDGAKDAETLMVDPLSQDIYIVSKRQSIVSVYRASYPQSFSQVNTLEKVASLPLTGITGGDMSQDGQEILLRSMRQVFYWRRYPRETVGQAFRRLPIEITSYQREPQGEAIAWHPFGDGFYTSSEELLGIPAKVSYYPRVGGAFLSR